MAKKQVTRFNVGDWTVHYNFGVGEVEDISEKGVGADRQTFYKIKTDRITYWLPLDNQDCNYVRPIRPYKEFNNAISILSQTPEPIETQFGTRKNVVHERWLDDSLSGRASLIRDLNCRDKMHKLNYNDKLLLSRICQTFLDEWIISDRSITLIQAQERLKHALKISMEHIVLSEK